MRRLAFVLGSLILGVAAVVALMALCLIAARALFGQEPARGPVAALSAPTVHPPTIEAPAPRQSGGRGLSPGLSCAIGAALFTAAIVDGPQRSPLRVDEWHHEYAGALLCGVGVLAHRSGIAWIGAALSLDDGVQHMYQRANGNLAIASPLTIAYRVTAGRWGPIVRLNGWLDRTVEAVLR